MSGLSTGLDPFVGERPQAREYLDKVRTFATLSGKGEHGLLGPLVGAIEFRHVGWVFWS